ncbi:hypothetical protein LCGC14_0908130 [marine sediment metagenome]|uniref:Uncharacterized protein n=1 Tax=marine sediment metagenome TaxID=412755 RepID=A0A0F9RDB9_9ZZZZ
MPVDPKVLTATTTVQQVASFSKRRTALAILNRSTSITAYIGNTDNVAAARGFDLPPTGTMVFSKQFGDDPRIARTVVTASGTAELTVLEEYAEESD